MDPNKRTIFHKGKRWICIHNSFLWEKIPLDLQEMLDGEGIEWNTAEVENDNDKLKALVKKLKLPWTRNEMHVQVDQWRLDGGNYTIGLGFEGMPNGNIITAKQCGKSFHDIAGMDVTEWQPVEKVFDTAKNFRKFSRAGRCTLVIGHDLNAVVLNHFEVDDFSGDGLVELTPDLPDPNDVAFFDGDIIFENIAAAKEFKVKRILWHKDGSKLHYQIDGQDYLSMGMTSKTRETSEYSFLVAEELARYGPREVKPIEVPDSEAIRDEIAAKICDEALPRVKKTCGMVEITFAGRTISVINPMSGIMDILKEKLGWEGGYIAA